MGSSSLNADVNAFRKTPNCPGLELLIRRLEVEVVHVSGKVFGRFQSALDERLIDDYFRSDIRQFTSLPGFHLLSHRLKASLHSVDTNRNAVDERERL